MARTVVKTNSSITIKRQAKGEKKKKNFLKGNKRQTYMEMRKKQGPGFGWADIGID